MSLLHATACLKLADAFDEHSNEYYQRDKTVAYMVAVGHLWSAHDLIEAEKLVAERLNYLTQFCNMFKCIP